MQRIALILTAALWLAAAAVPAMAGSLDFTVVNNEAQTMTAFAMAESGNKAFGENMFTEFSLAPGASVAISFDNPDNACAWDIKAVFEDGTEQYLENLDLCADPVVTVP